MKSANARGVIEGRTDTVRAGWTARMFLILGGVLLASSLRDAWFWVPSAAGFGAATAATSQPVYQLAVLLGLVGLLFSSRFRWSPVAACVPLVVALAFPCHVMVKEPEHAFRATELYNHASHLNTQIHHDLQILQRDWLRDVRLRSLDLATETLPVVGLRSPRFQVSIADWYLQGVGYGPAFFHFSTPAFLLLILGGLSLLLANCLAASDPVRALGSSLAAGSVVCLLVLGVLLVPVVSGARVLESARELSARGDYASAYRQFGQAASRLPVLHWSLTFRLAQGELLRRLGRHDHPDAELYRGLEQLQAGETQLALSTLRRAARLSPPDEAWLRNLVADLLVNQGIHELNDGHTGEAESRWREAVALNSNHMVAIHHLLVGAVAREENALGLGYADQLLTLQTFFNQPFRVISARAIQLKAWAYFRDDSLVSAAELAAVARGEVSI